METLSLGQAKILKKQLNEDIQKLLIEFQFQTGLDIDSISVTSHKLIGAQNDVVRVTVNVPL